MALTDEGNGGVPATMLVGPANIGGGMPYPVYQNSGNGNGFSGVPYSLRPLRESTTTKRACAVLICSSTRAEILKQ